MHHLTGRLWNGAAVACLLCLGWSSIASAQGTFDAYGGSLGLQCGPNTKAVTSTITTVARSSGVVTITFSSSHRFIVNDTIAVSGTNADGGSFNTPAGQLFTITSVPSSTTVSYTQSGSNVNPTSNSGSARLARFYVSKVGSRWWFCTPLGNAFWMNAVATVEHNSTLDYQNINNTDLVLAKYATGLTTSAVDNWAYQMALRLKTWGFNVLGEYSDVHVYPTTVDPFWKTSDRTIPAAARMAFIPHINPILYSAYNSNSYAPGPTKNQMSLYKKSVYHGGAVRGMADVYDPNFSAWVVGYLAKSQTHGQFTGPHHEYLLAFMGEESDTTGGFRMGSDFQSALGGGTSNPGVTVLQSVQSTNVIADPQLGWMVLLCSPSQTAVARGNTPKGLSARDILFTDTVFHSKSELGSWLQKTADRGPGYSSITALNTAWGSNYDSFASDALSHTETCATGNGTAGPYSCTLKNTPVTPLTLQVTFGTQLKAGDDGSGPLAYPVTSAGNLRSNTGSKSLGTITYSTGALSITFSSAVPAGQAISVTYKTNGWGQGHGLLDEDGTCPSRKTGQTCWVPTSPYWTAVSTENHLQRDLDGFLYHFSLHYFSIMKNDIQTAAPGYLYFPVNPLGGDGAPPRREVLEAARSHCDFLAFGAMPDTDPTGEVFDQQARLDFIAQYAGDLPWTNAEFMIAQADSYFPAATYPVTKTLSFASQLLRGQYYQTYTTAELTASISANCNCNFAGTYPVIGQNIWQFYDDPSYKTNYGIVTLRDDPYDGKASTPVAGKDQWGYVTGCQGAAALPGPTTSCEQGSYGDFIDSATAANSLWLTYAKH